MMMIREVFIIIIMILDGLGCLGWSDHVSVFCFGVTFSVVSFFFFFQSQKGR